MPSLLHAVDEPVPGAKWLGMYETLEAAYRRWFLKQGDRARPSYLACARALKRHMPELVGTWERLVELAGGGDVAARLLSLYRPTPYLTGCSQAVWLRGAPLLVRNYDYSPALWEGVLLRSRWRDRGVIGMSDSLWGVVDGINEDGLSVSLAFGGRRVTGDGFGMPLILRYVLETCSTARQAVAALSRVPSHMAYNITVVDRGGHYATVFVNPDREPVVLKRRYAANHQGSVDWVQFATATASLDRERFLAARLEDRGETRDRFVRRFLEPPLYSTRFDHGWGTLYTAVYDSASGEAAYHWPTFTMLQSFARFDEGAVTIAYPDPLPGAAH